MHNEYFKQTLPRAHKVLEFIEKKEFTELIKFKANYFKTKEHLKFNEKSNYPLSPISIGDVWGKEWDSAWFQLQAEIDPKYNHNEIYAKLDFNGEAQVYTPNGTPYQGLTNGSVFVTHQGRSLVQIPKSWINNNRLEIWVEASASNLFGITREKDPSENCPQLHGSYVGKYNEGALLIRNQMIAQFRRDLTYLLDLITELQEDSIQYTRIIKAIDDSLNIFQTSNGKNEECLVPLKKALSAKANHSSINIYAIGHAHIDTGWLWPVKETIRKCGRTFTNQLRLMEKYPNFKFGASQPQLYQFTKDYYPEVYEQIKKRVKEGRWECQGGMWVEADCNLISGESFVRQIFYGKKFYQDEFGIDVKNVWLPDVFGYSAAMPQIMKKAGIDYFMTQKISWSQYNKFPHHSFWWKGIDETKILTHFLPEDTYNSGLKPSTLIKAEKRFKDKAVSENILSLFGIGDGGGGPNEEQIERGNRSESMESCPKVIFSKSDEFFEVLKKESENFSTWYGELYLELHRGTLTTQAYVKKMNRKLEFAIRNLEYLYSLSNLNNYPTLEIENLWKKLLINQFHDILPGSSIHLVYETTHKEYQEMQSKIDELVNKWEKQNSENKPDSFSIINSYSSNFSGFVEVPNSFKDVTNFSDNEKSYSVCEIDSKKYIYVDLMPLSTKIFSISNSKSNNSMSNQSDLILENQNIKYEFTKEGQIISIIDKNTQYQYISANTKANTLSIYDDQPNKWDAWDIDIQYENCIQAELKAESYSIVNSNGFKQILFTYKSEFSTIQQTICLHPNTSQLDIHFKADWQEKRKMLRTAFPANIPNARAYYDIAYGYIERTNHRNTLWDYARFEVATHKYAGICNHNNGLFVINDSKYGYKILDQTIDVGLLRSPLDPDPIADRGKHEFKLSIFTHQNHFIHSNLITASLNFNNPPIVIKGKLSNLIPFQIDSENVTIEAYKKCENDNSCILRLVENKGCINSVNLTSKQIKKCLNVDLLENELDENKKTNSISYKLDFKPFEIKTLKLFF